MMRLRGESVSSTAKQWVSGNLAEVQSFATRGEAIEAAVRRAQALED